MNASSRWFALKIVVWGSLLGITVALWVRNLRPDPTHIAIPPIEIGALDRSALPRGTLQDPFVGTARLGGWVRDPEGRGIEGAAVHASVGKRLAKAATAADGSFLIDDLPGGPTRLVVGVEGFRTLVRDGLHLEPEGAIEESLVLEPRVVPTPLISPTQELGEETFILSGRCIDGWTGSRWYRVHLEPLRATDPGPRATIETDRNGTGFFEFSEVPRGKYRVRVTAAGGPSRDLLEFLEVEDVEVPHPGLTLRFSAIRLRLQVKDEAGDALGGARASLFWFPSLDGNAASQDPPRQQLVTMQNADENGRLLLLPMPAGNARLSVHAPGYLPDRREMHYEGDSLPRREEVIQITLRRR